MAHNDRDVTSSALSISVVLNSGIFALEIAGGLLSGSLALLSDAFHNLTDTLSLLVTFFAVRVAQRRQTPERTYGYRRAEILATLFNTLFLFGVSGYLTYEALQRFAHPIPLEPDTAFFIALFGLSGNLAAVMLLSPVSRKSLSVRSAFVHLLSDTLSSCAVILGVVLIKFSGFVMLDSLLSLGIVAFLLRETVPLFREALRILMQGSPRHVRPERIKERLEHMEGVANVHHLHLWSLNEKEHYAELHVVVKCSTLEEADTLRESIAAVLRQEFHIHHSTIQLERRACRNQNLIVEE